MDLDRRDLWSVRGDIAVHKLWETYARFVHMPRLASRETLNKAIADRATTITWAEDTFAYAEAHDGERWVGLCTDDAVAPAPTGLLIHPEHLPSEPDKPPNPQPVDPHDEGDDPPDQPGGDPGQDPDPASAPPTEFYAQFQLDFVRCINQLDAIIENVGNKLGDSDIELVLEIRAKNQQGFNEATRRTVSENAGNLKAQSSEFE